MKELKTTIVSIERELHKLVKSYAKREGMKLYRAYDKVIRSGLEALK